MRDLSKDEMKQIADAVRESIDRNAGIDSIDLPKGWSHALSRNIAVVVVELLHQFDED